MTSAFWRSTSWRSRTHSGKHTVRNLRLERRCVPLKGSGGGGSTPTTDGASKEAGDSENKEKQGESSGSPETEQQTEQASSTESEASSTGKQENPAKQTPTATTQTTQVPSTPPAEDTKCNAPARRLRKKLAKA
ncbi:hypothetical protein GN958_ATG16644 [Phytophthora infestans]|uniref:Uncharacterized protein n=1 Tax=Phytophthora infestans TaxID=4787 RepID=A0A8S9U4R8_PHYIN|nr:hypothetical protein GN958_ATG16644 [Phytophthora infestans]